MLDQSKKLREYADSLELRVAERTRELHDAHLETIYILAIASDAKDADTGEHVRRLKRMSQMVAQRMGLPPAEAERLGYSAVLHDVGKIHTPDFILKKPGALTPEERTEMQQHTLAGERILKPSAYFAQASRIARSHHENWDGSGYPDGLRGNRYPFRRTHRASGGCIRCTDQPQGLQAKMGSAVKRSMKSSGTGKRCLIRLWSIHF